MANSALYSTGVVAVLETKLLKKEKFNAMVEAESLESCLKILHDAGFADGKTPEGTGNFESLLQIEADKNIRLLQDLSSDQYATDCLLLRYDYHNLKTLLKAQSTNTPFNQIHDILYKGGLIDINVLQVELVTGGESLRPLMKEVVEKVSNTQNAKTIDVTADIAMYRDILGVLKRSRSKTVTKYFKEMFDFINISTFIRNKIAKVENYTEQFIKGGNLPLEIFTDAAKPLDEFFKSLKAAEYVKAAEIAEESLKNSHNLLGYELFYKNYLFEKVWESRDRMKGVEPVVYYFFAKEAEIDNIRLILTCKKNKVDKKMIYQRLRDTYA